MMGASAPGLIGSNIIGQPTAGDYAINSGAMGGLAFGQYQQQQGAPNLNQWLSARRDDGQGAANAATDATLNQMGQNQLLQAQRAGSGQPMAGIPGALQGQQGQPNNAFTSPVYAPQYGPRAQQPPQLQEGGQLPNDYFDLSTKEKTAFGKAAEGMGHTLTQHAAHTFEDGGQLSQEQYDGFVGDLSQEQQEGSYPVYQDGGQLLGYLPQHSFGSWLGDNAGKILKGVGGVISVIPPIGTIVGPILIGAGYATDAIVGAVRKNRAEDELVEAQGREEAAAQKRETSQALAAQFDPEQNIDYGATFETYQYGGGLMNQQQGVGSVMNPMIINYRNGQSHKGPQSGIPVDEKGNPVATSRQSAVGLTERGEVAWNGYIFSDNDDLTI
jgi:hypothetical protein